MKNFKKFREENKDDLAFCLAEVQGELQFQVNDLLKRRKMSEAELAHSLGVDEDEIEDILEGGKDFDFETMMRICIALQVRPEIVLRLVERHEALGGLKRYRKLRDSESVQIDAWRPSIENQFVPAETSIEQLSVDFGSEACVSIGEAS